MFGLTYLLQFELILGLCFSFFILIIVFFVDKEKNSIRLLGFPFLFPFFSGILAIFIRNGPKLLFLEKSSLVLFFLALIITFKINKIKKWFILYRATLVIISSSLFLLFTFSKFNMFPTWLNLVLFFLIIFELCTILFLTRNKSIYKTFFTSSFLFIAGLLLSSFTDLFYRYFTILLVLSSYIIFINFFLKNTLQKITSENDQLRLRFKEIDQNVEFEVKKRTIEIEKSNRRLVSISKTDSLTGSYNKAAILDLIEKHILDKRIQEFCIFMFDIDYFKKVNDTYGHLTGDKCIKTLAHLAQLSIRDVDTLGRYGGDEFLIVLPSTNLTQAKLVGERFRKKVEDTNSPHFTISIGVAYYPDDGQTVKDLIASADEGLYRSKNKGRNAISHHTMF